MFQNPRETPGVDSIRPLNPPIPIEVRENKHHQPVMVVIKGRKVKITSINKIWQIDEEWWRPQPIARRYYRVSTEEGRQITIFRDLVDGGWYRQNA